MAQHLVDRVWQCGKFDGATLVVLLRLATTANVSGDCFGGPSIHAKRCRLSEDEFETEIRRLKDAMVITAKDGQSGAVIYHVWSDGLKAD